MPEGGKTGSEARGRSGWGGGCHLCSCVPGPRSGEKVGGREVKYAGRRQPGAKAQRLGEGRGSGEHRGVLEGGGLQEGLTGCRKPVPGLDRAVCDPSGC